MAKFSDKEQNPVYSSASSVNGHEFISLLETQAEDFGVGLQLESLIRTDNKQAFVSFLKAQKFDFDFSSYCTFETRLLKLLCFRRAIGCATALLNGETGLPKMDLNLGLTADPLEDEVGDNPTPLELAAKMLCYGLTELFIKHGADPTLKGFECSEFIPCLPLKLALDSLCDHKIVTDFPAGESVYQLFSLFRLQELKEPLDTLKLLASKTKQQQITAVGVCCVEEWNLVKLAALLIVAWDKLVIDDDIYSSPIGKLIVLQHDLESDLEKKEVMKSMLHAFRLVEMSRYFLEANHTISMVEVANNLLSEVKLHDKGTHMVSDDLDRLAAQLLQRNKDFLETALVEKNCSNEPSTRNLKISAERKFQLTWWPPLVRLGDKVLLETRLMKKVNSKSMIAKCIYFCPKSPQRDIWEPEDSSFYDHLDRAMCLDDRYEFVKVVNGMESFDSLDCDYDLPTSVRKLMFLHDSANCAAAVLAGETNAFLKFRDLTDVGWSFLHNAAKLGNPKLTALFLENGFLADDRRDCDDLKIKAALPLNVALESIRDNHHIRLGRWKDNKSANDLVVLLCQNEQIYDLRNILETIRLLVLKTTNVYSEFLLYLKEGKMVELCALLMVAHKELLASDFVVDTLVPTSITHKSGGAGHMRHFSTSTGHGNSHEYNDPLERKGTLLLVAIFEKIGDYLSAYIRLEQRKSSRVMKSEVAWLISRAGISDALVSKIANTMFRMDFSDNKSVLGRVNCYSVEQDCGSKLPAGDRYLKQPAMKNLWTRGTSSSMSAAEDRYLKQAAMKNFWTRGTSSSMSAAGDRYLKQAAMKNFWTRGTSSSMSAHPLHTLPLKKNAESASLVSAIRPVNLLCRRLPLMRSFVVAALTSGFRRM